MSSSRIRLLAVLLLLSTVFASWAHQPRIAIVQTDDQYTHVLGLSEFLAGEHLSYVDLSQAFERGLAVDLSEVDLLIVGSFVTSDPQKKASYRSMEAAM